MNVQVHAIGLVAAERTQADDGHWGATEARITLIEPYGPEALVGLDTFSHVEVLFLFHQVDPARVATAARRPRDNPAWPAVGSFAQRGKGRPNRIGSTICHVVRVDGATLVVAELDAIAGTPVLDLKPVMQEFLPREAVRQPDWCHELMAAYWQRPDEG